MDYAFNFWLGIIVISTIGTLAHFLYEWSHHNHILGLFTAVNESTWEHIKLALTPILLWSLYDGAIYGFNPNYFTAKFISLLIPVFFIPFIFYSYKRITKKAILFVDICTFFIAILFSQLVFYVIIDLDPVWPAIQYLSCIGTFIFFGCYMTLTLQPLHSIIFKDPITGKYGFRAHTHSLSEPKNHHHSHKSSKTHK